MHYCPNTANRLQYKFKKSWPVQVLQLRSCYANWTYLYCMLKRGGRGRVGGGLGEITWQKICKSRTRKSIMQESFCVGKPPSYPRPIGCKPSGLHSASSSPDSFQIVSDPDPGHWRMVLIKAYQWLLTSWIVPRAPAGNQGPLEKFESCGHQK